MVPSTMSLTYYDMITEQKAKSVMEVCSNIVTKAQPSRLYFLLSSTGGSVDAGIVLYNYLRSLPVELIMHNVGSIDSIANVVFLAAETRLASPHSSFLLHGINWGSGQGSQLSYVQLQETLSDFRSKEEKLIGIITQRTQISKAELRRLFRQGESKDLEFALARGIIQDVKEPKIPLGDNVLSLNFP